MAQSTIVKLRGLPFTAEENDVISFFQGFSLDRSDPLRFQFGPDGRHSGICYVRFTSPQEAARSLGMNRQYLGDRYVEVFPSSEEELAQKTAPVGATNWVRMRGLPYTATKEDIKAFFTGFNVTHPNIFIVASPTGRTSGEAFVQFTDEYEAQRALLKDKEPIGMRYIELFLSTREECDSAIARYRDPIRGRGGFGGAGGFAAAFGGFAAPAALGYGVPTMGGFAGRGAGKGFARAVPAVGGECIVKLRGLPFRATEEDIVAFFAGLNLSQVSIVYVGGRASGEAFVELRDQRSFNGALQRNHQMMGNRYIEIFPASSAEMAAAASAAGFAPYGAAY